MKCSQAWSVLAAVAIVADALPRAAPEYAQQPRARTTTQRREEAGALGIAGGGGWVADVVEPSPKGWEETDGRDDDCGQADVVVSEDDADDDDDDLCDDDEDEDDLYGDDDDEREVVDWKEARVPPEFCASDAARVPSRRRRLDDA